MRLALCLTLGVLAALVPGYGTGGDGGPAALTVTPAAAAHVAHLSSRTVPSARPPRGNAEPAGARKVLIVVEENSSRRQMRSKMPYLAKMSRRYSFARNYTAISHPSLPNYLALTGGSTFHVHDDNPPAYHRIRRPSVFDQALNAEKSAAVYADSMPGKCARTSTATYAVKHNPWAYFVNSSRRCRRHDVPLGRARIGALRHDIRHATLPNVGLVVPNVCHDAHSCSLAEADRWLRKWLRRVLAGRDFAAGRLAVVVTSDEDDGSAGNHVLTVVMHEGTPHKVTRRALNHYSLLGYVDHVLGVRRLGRATVGFARAFGL